MAAAGVGLEWPEATAAPCSQGRMEAGQSGSAGLMEAHTWAWLLDGQGCAVHTPTPEPGPLGEKGPRPERRGAGAGGCLPGALSLWRASSWRQQELGGRGQLAELWLKGALGVKRNWQGSLAALWIRADPGSSQQWLQLSGKLGRGWSILGPLSTPIRPSRCANGWVVLCGRWGAAASGAELEALSRRLIKI